MKLNYMLFIVLATAISGCTSLPHAEFIDSRFSASSSDTHMVTIERGSTPGSNRAPLNVYVNGDLVVNIYGNQAVNLFLPSGRHRVGVAMNKVGVFGHGERGPDRAITIDLPGADNPILRASPIGGVLPVWGIQRTN